MAIQLDHGMIRGDHLTDLDAKAFTMMADGWPEQNAADSIAHQLAIMYPFPWDGCMEAARKIVAESYNPREESSK